MTKEQKQEVWDAPRDEQKDAPWSKVKELFFNNPTLVVTLLYLYVTGTGLLYSAVLYGAFGINIFDYSEISDLLLAALKNPLVITFVAAQASIICVGLAASRYFFGMRSQRPFRIAGIIILSLIATAASGAHLAATYAADSIKDGEAPAVNVRYKSFSGSAGQVTEPNLKLIGATQKAVFFYDVEDKHTLVIPQVQIVSIEVPEKGNSRDSFLTNFQERLFSEFGE